MNRLARRKFLVSVLLSAAPALSGQSYNAALVGQVTDPAGLAIQGATITARSNATGRVHRAYTDAAGQYLAGQLEPGVYEVEVSAPGFRTQRELDVSLELDAVQRLDTVLEIGPVTEQVMVREARTALPTDTGSISSAILGSEIANLPLNGRDYRTLALLAPGVAPAPAGANPFHVNGSRADHVSYLLDGLTAMDRRGNQAVVQPPLDSIQEFRVLTNSFSAEYGRIAGGVVSVALKSGSNERHGSLFAFLRNDLFDARGFFDQNAPVLRRNQFGAVVGAPVVRNRVFFMSAYEGLRNRERETRLTRVPTEAERSGAVGRALDPRTGALFPGGQIAPARIDPVASRLLEFFPLPNREGALNYASLGTVSSDRDSGAMRLDFYATSKDHLAGRLVINDARRTSPFRATSLPGFGSVSAARDQFWAVSYTRVLTPSSTNELRFGFGRSQFAENAVNGSRDAGALTGMTGVPPASGLPATTIAGYAPIGDPAPLPDRWTDNEFMVSDTISLVNGRHWIRAGGEVQRSQHFNLFAAYHAGQLVFLGAATRNPIADFLLGAPTATQRQIGTNKSYLFGLTSGMFVQDDWRIHPRLTLNLGIRHDLYRPPVEKYDRWANFIPELGARVLAGDSRFPRSLMRTHGRTWHRGSGLRGGRAAVSPRSFAAATAYSMPPTSSSRCTSYWAPPRIRSPSSKSTSPRRPCRCGLRRRFPRASPA